MHIASKKVMNVKKTTLCYLEKDHQYLMLHRTKKKKDANQGKWIGLGGAFLDHESAEACMKREVLEETGFHVTEWQYKGIVTFISDVHEDEVMHLFKGLAWEGTLKPCDEGELAWVDKAALFELPMWEGDRIFLKLLDQDIPFFALKLVYEGNRLAQAFLDGRPLNRDNEND